MNNNTPNTPNANTPKRIDRTRTVQAKARTLTLKQLRQTKRQFGTTR